MADDTTSIQRSEDEMAHANHFCEFPGCARWGGFGYDVGRGQSQWFCDEHRWTDYRLGLPPRIFFDEEAAGIGSIMAEPLTAARR
jgi:hypothetical protein